MSFRVLSGLVVLFFITFSVSNTASAQELLTLEEAVAIGLENNYGIKISRNTVEQASRKQQHKRGHQS
jgi:hypothetical protein